MWFFHYLLNIGSQYTSLPKNIWPIFSYRIDDMQSAKKFVLNVKLSACFDKSECIFEEKIMNNVYVPKPLCNWDADYVIPGKE